MGSEARGDLFRVARSVLEVSHSQEIALAPEIMRRDSSIYTDAQYFERERESIFRRVPIMVAASSEISAAGDYKAMELAGVPILITRGKDGSARAFLNGCSHRAAFLVDEGCGNKSRFVCPYHGWTFNSEGQLVGVSSRSEFGEVDLSSNGLVSLPTLEKYGLIWVVLSPNSSLDINAFLGRFGEMLGEFGFETWHFVRSRELKGANWKLAFEAHLEFYHLPVLHANTFGPQTSPKASYHFWGPHQRLTQPAKRQNRITPEETNLFDLGDRPENEWPMEALMLGEWILFPNVSINSFYDGGRGVLISQVLPGESVSESITIQTYLMAQNPSQDQLAAANKLCDFLEHVVRDEDLPTSIRQQKVLNSGLMPTISIGRNEGGIQRFHHWIDLIMNTEDSLLTNLFQ